MIRRRRLLSGTTLIALAIAGTLAPARGTPVVPRAAAGTPGLEVAAPPLRWPALDTLQAAAATEVTYGTVAHRAGGIPVAGKVKRSPRAVAHYTGFDGWEPTLGLTSNGHIFAPFSVDVCCGLNEVLRSRDGGDTWEMASPKLPNGDNTHLVSADPYIYVDPKTDRVFTIDLTLACSMLSFSDDGGDTWTTNPLACGQPINDHQTLFSGPPIDSAPAGYPQVLYYCFNHLALLSSFCSKSLDGGLTFVPTGTPAHGRVDPSSTDSSIPFVCGGTTGHGVVGPDGAVYLPRVDCDQPWLAISRDEGRTWERIQVADNGGQGHEAGVAVDDKDNIYMTWTSDQENLPYLSVSRDQGETWSEPLMVGAPGLAQGVLPGIAVGGPGQIALVYMGTDSPDATYWNGYVTTTTDALSPEPIFHTARIGTAQDPLTFASCLHRCESLGDFFDVVVAPDGKVWAALVDGCLACDGRNNDEQGVMVEVRGRSFRPRS